MTKNTIDKSQKNVINDDKKYNNTKLENIDEVIVSKEDKSDKVLSTSTSQEIKASISDALKKSLTKIFKIFHKNISDDVLYANLPLDTNKTITTTDIPALAKKAGLSTELRRINLLDIAHGPAIILCKTSCYVIIDDKTGYNPVTNKQEELNRSELADTYIGYAMFFFEETLTISKFVEKTGFLFKSISKFRPILIEMLVTAFFINMFVVVSPIYTMNVYDRVIPNAAISTLLVLSLGMLIMYVFDFVFKMIKSYLADYISLNIGSDVDQVLLSKLLLAKSQGVTMTDGAKGALFRELSMVREFYFSRFIPGLIDIPFLLLFFGVLLLISPYLALVPFIAASLVFIVNILLQVPLQNTHSKMLGEEQQRASLLTETIAGSENIKTFNAVGYFLHKWKRTLAKTYHQHHKHNLWVHSSTNFSMLVMNVVTILMVVVGVLEITNNVMTTGGLIASTTISGRIMATVISFSGLVVRYRSINATLRHVEKVVLLPSEEDNASYGKKGPFSGNIRFNEVSFFYPGLRKPILQNCNLQINSKDKVAIIGKTGAGKSTITRLILGLDFPNGGQIFIDNIDASNININELRANIGFMPQKPSFFSGTVRENIFFGATNISEEQYKLACELAGVSLITSLSEKGDDMLVAEGGRNLSGGQQQILSLARAILKDPPIIIMDEPTNGMDTSLEALFIDHVTKYVKNKTFILITHKPSQLSLVDRVILVDNSTIAIDGSKEDVLKILSKGQSTI